MNRSPRRRSRRSIYSTRSRANPACMSVFVCSPGNIVLVNNLTVLYARTRVEDHEEQAPRRHVLRLLLDGGPGFRDALRELNFFNAGESGIPLNAGVVDHYDMESLRGDAATGGVPRLVPGRSTLARPCSAKVGTSGRALLRWLLVMASTLTFPDRENVRADPWAQKAESSVPPTMSVIVPISPFLYGTCRRCAPLTLAR